MRKTRLHLESRPRRAAALVACLVGAFTLALPAKEASVEVRAADSAPEGSLEVQIRDSLTGYGVNGTISARAVADLPWLTADFTEASHHQTLQLPRGDYALRVTAPGYRAIDTHFSIEPETQIPVTVWLDPETPSREIRPDVVKSKLKTGYAMLHGHIVDVATGDPLSGVEVRVNSGQTRSDARGYFVIYVPVNPVEPGSLPEAENLTADLPGYKTYLLTQSPLAEGDTHFLIDMELGRGVTGRDDTHKMMRSGEELRRSQSASETDGESPDSPEFQSPPDEQTVRPANILLGRRAAFGVLAVPWAPPASIRVGLNCSCATCSSVAVMSLETYTKRGLNDEWIASWRPHSLRAGAIAYRSYGSYYVDHPRNPNYDICSTTCCQVNDADTSASTNSAVDYTAGILLERNGAIFRSEYSAENNNFNCGVSGCSNSYCGQCGDGFAGSPGANWPCVEEPLDAGRNCFGHGRGMCQWGTQRWALQGELWNWIEDKYYNNNGNPGGLRSAYMTSPLDISSSAVEPSEVAPGGTFAVFESNVNYAELEHSQVMLGASLYSEATGYISDPAGDQKVILYPGTTDVSRPFTVPAETPAGTYDLLVALWLDVDEDSAVSGADLPLVWYWIPAAVTVF